MLRTICLLLLGVGLACGDLSAATIRLLPLGDSITYGYTSDYTPIDPGGYRTRLYQRLVSQMPGYRWDFVGTADDKDPLTPYFIQQGVPDIDHEGHPGWRIDQITSNIKQYLRATGPAAVMLHLGTNDMIDNYDRWNAPERLNYLIDQIRRYGSGVFVAKIIGSTNYTKNLRIQYFNDELEQIVKARRDYGTDVVLVDAYSAVSMSNMADAYHPNPTGYDQLADAWFDAIWKAVYPTKQPPAPPPLGSAMSLASEGISLASEGDLFSAMAAPVHNPEPATMGLLAAGAMALLVRRRR